MKKGLLIFGARSTAIEIKEIAEIDYSFYKVLLVDKENKNKNNKIILESELEKIDLNIFWYFIIGMSDINTREKCISIAEKFNFNPISIISKDAFISKSAKIGKGVYIAPNASIAANVIIKKNIIVNFNSTIGHDSVISDNVIINPGARISGDCVIEKNVLVGANSFIHQGCKIGKNSQIDAMTHIFKNIEQDKMCTSRNLKIFVKRK